MDKNLLLIESKKLFIKTVELSSDEKKVIENYDTIVSEVKLKIKQLPLNVLRKMELKTTELLNKIEKLESENILLTSSKIENALIEDISEIKEFYIKTLSQFDISLESFINTKNKFLKFIVNQKLSQF